MTRLGVREQEGVWLILSWRINSTLKVLVNGSLPANTELSRGRWRAEALAQAQSGSTFSLMTKELCLSTLPMTSPESHGNMLNFRIRIQKDFGT